MSFKEWTTRELVVAAVLAVAVGVVFWAIPLLLTAVWPQMWAAFLLELDRGKPPVFGCFTPEETRISHALHTAALASNRNRSVEPVKV